MGYIQLKLAGIDRIQIYMMNTWLNDPPPFVEDQHFHYHEVNSEPEISAVRCLLNVPVVDRAHVFTWYNLLDYGSGENVSSK